MALPEQWEPLWGETEDSIRARMLDSVPEQFSTVEGTPARDLLEVGVGEFRRLYSRMEQYMSYRFIRYSWGPLLDAHGENYGIARLEGTKATGMIRFTGDEGAQIKPATNVGVPSQDPTEERPVYETLNTSTAVIEGGSVTVPAVAIDIGSHANVAPGAVTLLESPDVYGIASVENLGAMTGGSDPQDDEGYRRALLEAAALPAGSGTLRDHVGWALTKPGVRDVAAHELWDTSGTIPGVRDGRENRTIILSLRGPSFVAVDWSELEAVQKFIDPDRQVIALMEEGEPWQFVSGDALAPVWFATDVQTGEKSMMVANASATTAILRITRAMDLSRFQTDDDFYLWLKSDDWSLVSATTKARFCTDDSNYFEMALSNVAAGGTTKPSTDTDAWWLWRSAKGNAVQTGSPDWSAITKVELHVTTSAEAYLIADYWTIRSVSGAIPEGVAPVGQAVTVVTPVPKEIDVSAAVTLDAGYTLSGAPGTTNATEQIRAALEEHMRTVKPGQPVRVGSIHKAIANVPGVIDVIVRSPGAVTVLNDASLTLPDDPIIGESFADFLANGTAWINDQKITYTAKTSTQLQGVEGGSGAIPDNSPIRQSEVPVSVNQYPVLGDLTLST